MEGIAITPPIFIKESEIMSYKVQKPCKVCGKLYTPCNDCENDKEIFRWRTVACSYKCGQEYLRRVMEARSDKREKENKKEDILTSNYVAETKTAKKTVTKSETRYNKNKKESEQIG